MRLQGFPAPNFEVADAEANDDQARAAAFAVKKPDLRYCQLVCHWLAKAQLANKWIDLRRVRPLANML